MSAPAPTVSVIIAAWKAAGFIAPAIRSALGQEGVDLEVIVVDDASPDDTLQAARAAGQGDPRLRVERLAQNGGPSAARNHALMLAQGRFIAVLDADDTFEPTRLKKLVEAAQRTGADIIADNMNRVSEPGATADQGTPFLKPEALAQSMWVSLGTYLDPRSDRRFGASLGYLKPLFRAETLRRTKLSYDTRLRNSEDFYLVASLLAEGARFLLIPERGYNYLVRPGSISHRLNPDLTRAILEADTGFVHRYGARFDSSARRAASARATQLRKVHAFERFIAALKRRDAGHVAATLRDHPGALGHIAGRLGGIAMSRLRA